MHLLLKWRRLVLALVTAFVRLAPEAATLLEVEGSGAVPGFHSSEQLSRYLILHMAEVHLAKWRFEPATAGDANAPDHVEWRFKSGPYAGGEVRTFVPPYDITFGDHRPITIEARLYLNGKYRRLVKKRANIEGGPDDPDLAAAVASLTQHLLSPSRAHRSTCPKSLCCRRSPTRTRSSAPAAIIAPTPPRPAAPRRRTRRSSCGSSIPWSRTISRWCAPRSRAISTTRANWPSSSGSRAGTSPKPTPWATSSATPASTTARSGTSSSSTRSPPARTSTRRAALGRGSSPPTRFRTRRGSI